MEIALATVHDRTVLLLTLTTMMKRKFSRMVTVSVAVWIGRLENKETGPLYVNYLLAVRVSFL